MSNKTTVETVSIDDIKEGDTLLDGDGERIVVKTITSCSPYRLRYQDAEGENRLVLLDRVLRVVPDEPTEEEPVWPDADFIRIIRGTENGVPIDGSLAFRINGGRGFRLLDGPRADSSVLAIYEGDAILGGEEAVPVSKPAVPAAPGPPTEDDDTDDTDSEDEDEEECDGSCLACTFMRLIAAVANRRESEEATE